MKDCNIVLSADNGGVLLTKLCNLDLELQQTHVGMRTQTVWQTKSD